MSIKQKGIIYTVISTIIFGMTPAIGKLTYAMGNNGIQLAFLRHLFVLPLFFIMAIIKGLSFRMNKQQAIDVFKVSLGNALTIVLLYSSYGYIHTSTATVLHFLYPLFVCLLNFIIYHQPLNQKQALCLVLAIIGVFCFFEKSSSLMGLILAIVSGIFFAYYMIGMDHSSVRELSPYIFNFYLVCINLLIIFILALCTQSFHLLPMKGYVLSFLVAIFTSFVAVVFLQKGIYCLGASLTAILSTLEPITSVIVGIVFLGEGLTILKGIGCVLVLLATFILVYSQSEKSCDG